MEVNSLAYWNARFDGDWRKNAGNRQTAGFAAMFIDNLPAFLEEAFKRGCTLCDWGCAEGEATRALSLAFPSLKAVGVDFSASAVANASARFPANRFLCQDWTSSAEVDGKYDCVFASNVLEHFPNPFDVLWDVLALRTQKYLVIMVPFEEPVVGMCPEHMARFTRSSFPLRHGDWLCAHFRVLEPVPGVFNGRECVVVYSRVKGGAWSLDDVAGGTDVAAGREVERLLHENAVMAERVKTAEAQRQVRYEQDKQIIQESSTLKARIAGLEADLKTAQESAKCALMESAESKSSLSKCEERLSETSSALAKSESKLSETLSALAKSEVKLAETSSALAKSEVKLSETSSALVKSEAKLSETSSALAKSESKLSETSSALAKSESKLAETSSVLAKSESKLAETSSALAKSESKLSETSSALAKSESKLAETSSALAKSEAKLSETSSALAKSEVKLSETSLALAKTESKLSETSSALAKSESKLSETSSALAKSESTLAAACKAREALAKRADFLERSLKNADARYQQLALSKLGRLTLWYWRHKDALKARLGRGKPVVRPVVPAKSAVPAKPAAPAKSAVPAKPVVPARPAVPAKKTAAPAKPAVPKELPKGDEGFFARVSDKIKDMPVSNGCRYYAKLNRRIAVVCDQFYWDSVKAAADFVYIDPEKWQECIKDIDCLLIVSAWHGLGSGTDWQGLAYEGTKRRALAYEIIDTCKERGIPTIFYSKEDPPSYAEFLGLAKRCDCVFTSDDGCVARYLADCGHDRVFPLRFCINPTYHNPVGTRYRTKERNVFFAGSWMTKFPERCTDMERMLDGVLEAGRGLNIVDRCYHLRNDERYRYPEKYLKYQAPAVDHDSLQKIHKLFDWCININTVKDSSTMFANRVYELQANGNLLISNYSLGVSNTFPNVFMIHDTKEVGLILNAFTDDEIYERQTAGVRRVMTGETCYDRVAEMLQAVGLAEPPPVRKVLVIATKTTDRVKEMFELQTYGAKTLTDLDHVTPEMYADADIAAFFDADADYGAYYLEDMINGFKYTNCDYVTKAAYVNETGTLVEGKEHDYISAFADRTRTVFWRDAFTLEELLGASGAVQRENGYASDHFSYALRPQTLPRIENPVVSAVIPVHNNGRFLYGRAFAALRRSSLFPRMEIIIVDDGSTDGWTPKVVRELESRYSNVRAYFFTDGGSGSPSRPRNQGVRMAKAPCIIFHDPDNEGIMDGYAALYNALQKNPETDLTIGNTVRCDGRLMTFDYYSVLKKCAGGVSFTNCRKMVAASNFLPANIQTMAIRREFLLQNGLEQVPGGIGEDSLLCNQMMFAARRIEVVPVKVQIYYAERGDSIVNSVTPKFFDKHTLTEVARVKWIVPAGLMEDYVKNRYAPYVTGWYFDKLRHANPELADECARKLFGILKLYDGYYKGGCKEIDAFLAKCRAGDFHGAYEEVVAMKKK